MKFYVATTMLVLAATVMGAAFPEPNDAAAASVSFIESKISQYKMLTRTSASNCLVIDQTTGSGSIIVLNCYSILPEKP